MSVRMCWGPNTKGDICGGKVKWTELDERWASECGKCGASGRAATGERRELEAEKGRAA